MVGGGVCVKGRKMQFKVKAFILRHLYQHRKISEREKNIIRGLLKICSQSSYTTVLRLRLLSLRPRE